MGACTDAAPRRRGRSMRKSHSADMLSRIELQPNSATDLDYFTVDLRTAMYVTALSYVGH